MDTKTLDDIEKKLLEPLEYYNSLPCKNIRKFVCEIIGKILFLKQKEINNVIKTINNIHNASLIIDDIQDNSFLRRNNDCAHIKYGTALALNSAYLIIFKEIFLFDNLKISRKYEHKIKQNIYYAHIGQGMDIYYTQNKVIPSLNEYYIMMEYKTGMIFVTILDLLFVNKKCKEKYDQLLLFVKKLSIFFQIRDDYINLTDVLYWKDKGFCQDFDEQKISFLIVYCNNHQLENYEIINELLNKQNKTIDDKTKLLRMMHNNTLLDKVFNILDSLKNELLEIINEEGLFNQLKFNKFDKKYIDEYLNIKK